MAVNGDEAAETPHQSFDTILVLDFGSQYSHLITRRLRELNVLAEMLPCTTKVSELSFKPKGIILSGGPYSVYQDGAPHTDPGFLKMGDTPVLGICYGQQELAWRLSSANVVAGTEREYGNAEVTAQRHGGAVDRLFEGLPDTINVYMSHGDRLSQLPEGFCTIATTRNSPHAGIAHQTRPIYGIQFHPEVEHTPKGKDVLKNFAVNICGAKQDWVMSNFCELEIARIRNLVGPTAQVIGAVSGGVDSTVAAKLLQRAIGSRFHAIFVDNGVLRLNEAQEVKKTLAKHLDISLTVVDAADRFLAALKGVELPEKKRKIIGSLFIDIFEEEAIRLEKEAENTSHAGPVKWFLQGTIYPDRIESLSFKGNAAIKSHHNVAGLPQRMIDGQGLQLIEPLAELYKKEVRALGRELGIPAELVNRHPFPGPGLAVRIIGEVTPERVRIARQADHIYISMIREAGLYDQISQAYAGLSNDKAVGVMGDKRYEGYIVILRAVETTDFMTANVFPFDMRLLGEMSRRIVNEVDGVALVTYNVTSKPPGTIELL